MLRSIISRTLIASAAAAVVSLATPAFANGESEPPVHERHHHGLFHRHHHDRGDLRAERLERRAERQHIREERRAEHQRIREQRRAERRARWAAFFHREPVVTK